MKVERTSMKTVLRGESIAQIRIENTIVETPTPMITTTDVNYADELTNRYEVDLRYPHKIHEIREAWSLKRLQGLTKYGKLGEKIEWLIQQRAKSLAKKFMYTPIFNDDVIVSKDIVLMMLKLQAESGIELINLSDSPTIPTTDALGLIKDCAKTVRDMGREPFLQIRANYSDTMFKNKTEVAKELGLSGITVMHYDPIKYLANYKLLAELREGGLMRHLSNIDRIWRGDGKSAVMPYGMLFADTYSTKMGRGGSKKKADGHPIKPKPRVNARRYDWNTSAHLRISEHRQEHGEELNCGCPICIGNTMADVVADYSRILYPAFRTHEPYALHTFADFARARMRAGTLKEFLTTKKYAPNALKNVFGIGQQEID